jgi:hypothetical protein
VVPLLVEALRRERFRRCGGTILLENFPMTHLQYQLLLEQAPDLPPPEAVVFFSCAGATDVHLACQTPRWMCHQTHRGQPPLFCCSRVRL